MPLQRSNSPLAPPRAKSILQSMGPIRGSPAANPRPMLSNIPLRLAHPAPNYLPAPMMAPAGAPPLSAPSSLPLSRATCRIPPHPPHVSPSLPLSDCLSNIERHQLQLPVSLFAGITSDVITHS